MHFSNPLPPSRAASTLPSGNSFVSVFLYFVLFSTSSSHLISSHIILSRLSHLTLFYLNFVSFFSFGLFLPLSSPCLSSNALPRLASYLLFRYHSMRTEANFIFLILLLLCSGSINFMIPINFVSVVCFIIFLFTYFYFISVYFVLFIYFCVVLRSLKVEPRFTCVTSWSPTVASVTAASGGHN